MVEEINHDRHRFLATAIMTIHTSYNDYEIVAANLLEDDQRRVSDRITACALYIDSPLGRAGMTETEVRKSGRKALIAKRPMARVGRDEVPDFIHVN